MSLLRPDRYVASIDLIDLDELAAQGVRCILFDRDNTPMITNQNIYFLPMKRGEMSNNPNLEQTKGWENGTFDPQAGL